MGGRCVAKVPATSSESSESTPRMSSMCTSFVVSIALGFIALIGLLVRRVLVLTWYLANALSSTSRSAECDPLHPIAASGNGNHSFM